MAPFFAQPRSRMARAARSDLDPDQTHGKAGLRPCCADAPGAEMRNALNGLTFRVWTSAGRGRSL
jgi:hypothetical protein